MRHRRKTTKLQRTTPHRRALLANLTCSLIEHGRIRTTLAKAKALRPVAEKMVTLGKKALAVDDAAKKVHYRRQAVAFLGQKSAAKALFEDIAPAASERQGGYTRITKLGQRASDAAPMAYIEWVDAAVTAGETEEAAAES